MNPVWDECLECRGRQSPVTRSSAPGEPARRPNPSAVVPAAGETAAIVTAARVTAAHVTTAGVTAAGVVAAHVVMSGRVVLAGDVMSAAAVMVVLLGAAGLLRVGAVSGPVAFARHTPGADDSPSQPGDHQQDHDSDEDGYDNAKAIHSGLPTTALLSLCGPATIS